MNMRFPFQNPHRRERLLNLADLRNSASSTDALEAPGFPAATTAHDDRDLAAAPAESGEA